MRRTLLGILAFITLAVSIPAYIWYPATGTNQAWIAAAIRIGLMLVAVWIAQPQLMRMSPTVWIAIFLIIVLAARLRYLVIFFVIGLIVLALLRPRGNRANKSVSNVR